MKIKFSRRSVFDSAITMNVILALVAGLSTEQLGSNYLKMDVETSPHNSIHCLAGIYVSNHPKDTVLGSKKDAGLIVYVPWDNHKVFVKYFKNSSINRNLILGKFSKINTSEEFYKELRLLNCLETNCDLAQYWMSL